MYVPSGNLRSDRPAASTTSGLVLRTGRPFRTRPSAVTSTESPAIASTTFPIGAVAPGQPPFGTYPRDLAKTATSTGRHASTVAPRTGGALLTRYRPIGMLPLRFTRTPANHVTIVARRRLPAPANMRGDVMLNAPPAHGVRRRPERTGGWERRARRSRHRSGS